MEIIALHNPIKLKIKLEEMPYDTYRKVLVPDSINMMQLHYIIQLSMGWEMAHLFQFTDKKYNDTIRVSLSSLVDDYFDDENEILPDEAFLKKDFHEDRERKPFWYWYDFGDDWWHKISFQKCTKKELASFKGTPICTEAIGACPLENSGGPWGYADFLEILEDKKHPEHAEFREWAGLEKNEQLDTEFVDLNLINEQLIDFFTSDRWNISSDIFFR